MKTYVGIDPGKTGCVVILKPNRSVQPDKVRTSLFETVNTLAYMAGEVEFYDAEKVIDLRALVVAMTRDTLPTEIFVLLEKPQIMHPKRFRNVQGEMVEEAAPQGVVGMLNYGIGYGKYLGMLEACGIPYGEIHPMTWKKEFTLIGKPKEGSIAVAKAIFPHVVDSLSRKKDHGRAEALLIAEYARRKNM